MKIKANEVVLKGRWIYKDSEVVQDKACERILELVNNYLLKVGGDSSEWDTFYKDPADGRYWVLTYPDSESHGGGPPELRCVDEKLVIGK